jgi:lipid-A-disaccharide synthase
MARVKKDILIVAGEASADRYGGRLVERLRALPGGDELSFFGTGGDRMSGAGVHLLGHVRDLAHIGPREALVHLWEYYEIFRRLGRESTSRRPALALLLDFPEFNLRLARKLKRAGVPVIYYISPQLWAWRRHRIRSIQRYVDKMLVILPFEEAYYRRHGVQVEFVGHPILEEFKPDYDRQMFLTRLGLDPSARTIALLPGSRRKELHYMLPEFARAASLIRSQTGAQCLISVAPTIPVGHVREILSGVLPRGFEEDGFRLVTADSRDILANCDFAMVKSGTSTLEAALVGTPFLIAYKLSRISWVLGNRLIHTPFKGLVNLIAGEEIVPEYMQDAAKAEALSAKAIEYLRRPDKADAMRSRLGEIRQMLSCRCASESVAAAVSRYLQ